MKCPKCNNELSDNIKFCTRCGTKIDNNPGKATFCSKCGAQLKAGAKFCSKCGNDRSAQLAQNTQNMPPMQAPQSVAAQQPRTPVQNAAPQQPRTPVQNAAPQQAPKKKSALPVVLIIIVLLIALLVGGYFVLDKVFDVNPIAMITGNDKDDKDKDGKDKDDKDKDDKDGKDKENKDDKDKKDKEPEQVDPAVLEALEEQIKTARTAYDGGSYEDALRESKAALNRYITLSKDYALDDDAAEQIQKAYEIASKAAVAYCTNIEKQQYGSAGYEQVRSTADSVLEIATALKENGYRVDSAELTEYSDGIVQRFKNVYIDKINEITEREQWSRDEAWNYAQEAYSIQENGKTVLFDESDLDDPLRLRYVYCLAWIQRKRCENGVADGSMTNEDAFNAMIAILEETDYNLLVLQDIIAYGNAAQKDTSGYQAAYNAIVQELKDEQGLSIVNSGVNSGTSVDVRKFWYFNDLDDVTYQVDIKNGTTQATRDWIRENIPWYI